MGSLASAARMGLWLTWIQVAAGFWIVGMLTSSDGPGDYVFVAILLSMGLVPALPGVYLAWRTKRRPRTWLLLLEASVLYLGWHVMAAGTALGWWRRDAYDTMRRGGFEVIQLPGPLGVTAVYHLLVAAGFLLVCVTIIKSPKPKLILPEPMT